MPQELDQCISITDLHRHALDSGAEEATARGRKEGEAYSWTIVRADQGPTAHS